LPSAILGASRRNSAGLDLADAATLSSLRMAMESIRADAHHAAPMIGGNARDGESRPVLDPADTRRVAGTVVDATPTDVADAIARAVAAQPYWNARPVAERAACLERAADAIEADREALMTLAVSEAGKSVADALAEVREAIDFCRYYAEQAKADRKSTRLNSSN